MQKSRQLLLTVLIPFVALIGACVQPPVKVEADNGIYVSQPKIYNDRALQLQLAALRSRLSQLSGIDQGSLTSRIGSLQGASATQRALGIQAGGLPMPGTTTTTGSSTPSVAQTVGSTSTQAPSGLTTGTTNQTITTNPSSTTQTVTTAPTVTPAPAPLPASPSVALPSAYSVSSLDALNEQMQLSYEIINLQLLLQGSLADDYSTITGVAKRHSTIGFPISISTPSDKQYRHAVAEIQVSICSPATGLENSPPTLITILPREKTYNVASITSNSVGLGAGAVVSNVLSLGVSFLWGHQTYYVVQAQDTIALQRKPTSDDSCESNSYQAKGAPVRNADGDVAIPSRPVTFAWQFRPVLGQPTIHQGLRQTFAQVSFPPGQALPSRVNIRTRWRQYDAKSGIAGKEIEGSAAVDTFDVKTSFETATVNGINQTDNGDGSVTTVVRGHFLASTQVRVGDTYFGDSSPGFDNNTGVFLRFSAPIQLAAARNAMLISPDGQEVDLTLPDTIQNPLRVIDEENEGRTVKKSFVRGIFGRGTRARLDGRVIDIDNRGYGLAIPLGQSIPEIVRPDSSVCQVLPMVLDAEVKPFSESLVEIRLPLSQCIEIGPPPGGGPYPLVAILAGKVFGMSDAPFRSMSPSDVTFLAPKALVQGQPSLTLKRLYLGNGYRSTYNISPANGFSVTGIAVLSTSDDETTYAVTGSKLQSDDIRFPTGVVSKVWKAGTYQTFTLNAKAFKGVKQLVFQSNDDVPIFVTLPAVTKQAADDKAKLTSATGIPLGSSAAYTIAGFNLQQIMSIRYLDAPLPFSRSSKNDSVTLQLPSSIAASPGIKPLTVMYIDGTSSQFDVIVNGP